MIKYLGSKRTLVGDILRLVQSISDVETVLDLFSGTSRVGYALKNAGYRVVSNDHNAYAATLACCYVQSDAEDLLVDAQRLVDEFNQMTGSPGYFTETYCVKSRFFRPENGERVDAIRERIAQMGLYPELEAVMLTSLMEEADRVDSTTGVQMAYLKAWAPRAHNALKLRVPKLLPQAKFGKSLAVCSDALDAARRHPVDLAYLDPPYNQHKYLGNYHIWETLVLWDKPEVYGIACKREDCRTRRSMFNSRVSAATAFREILAGIDARYLLISFSNEGFFSRQDMETMLAPLGAVSVYEFDYARYVGAKIGIYNPSGNRVGKVSHVRNKELMYLVRKNYLADYVNEPAGPILTF